MLAGAMKRMNREQFYASLPDNTRLRKAGNALAWD
jgi:hypothetical protein